MRKRSFLRARRIGFSHGSELQPPALRFAPPQCPNTPMEISILFGASWPYRGDWSELCIASGTFRETMDRRTGVSALRNPGGAQPDVH